MSYWSLPFSASATMPVPQAHRRHMSFHHQGGAVIQVVVAVLKEPADSQKGKATTSWLLLCIPFRLLQIRNNCCLLIALEIGSTRGKKTAENVTSFPSSF
jgi:hypothetical protein